MVCWTGTAVQLYFLLLSGEICDGLRQEVQNLQWTRKSMETAKRSSRCRMVVDSADIRAGNDESLQEARLTGSPSRKAYTLMCA